MKWAGPYADDSHEIRREVTPDLMAALKDGFRASFELCQPQ
jgi:hypothetical protein